MFLRIVAGSISPFRRPSLAKLLLTTFALFLLRLCPSSSAVVDAQKEGHQNQKKSAAGTTTTTGENLSATVFKFIYNNEKICGDMFVNSSWLPAHQNCELKCRMDSEICQMSSESVLIRRQRCFELPVECRRRLKQLLGGAELYTKPKRREGPVPPRKVQQKSQQKPAGQKERKSHLNHRDPPASAGPIVLPTPRTPAPSSVPPRQIHITLDGRRPLSPELVPLSQDRQILIPPAQLLSGTAASLSPASKVAISRKKGPIQLPSQSREQMKHSHQNQHLLQSFTSKPKSSTSSRRPATEKVDDSLQVAYQTLYMDTSTASSTRVRGGTTTTTSSTILATISQNIEVGSTGATSTAVTSASPPSTGNSSPSSSNLQLPQGALGANQSAEWTSAELGQPFAGNPFGVGVPIASGDLGKGINQKPTELSVLSAPLLTQFQLRPSGGSDTLETADVKATKSAQKEQQNYEVFGPPTNSKQLVQQELATVGIVASEKSAPAHSQPSVTNGYLPRHQPSPIQIKPIVAEHQQKAKDQQKQKQQPTNKPTPAALLDARNAQQLLREYQGKQMTWWSWRALAESLRGKKPPYNTDGGGIFSLDKSALCCQWALDGLCDRSWQRVRELCPKSCGTVVCSSIDGTLSCNRLVNVDVIACYEQRRSLRVFAAPTFDADFVQALQQLDQVGTEPDHQQQEKPAEQRAYAVEEEIKLLGTVGRQQQQQQQLVEEQEF